MTIGNFDGVHLGHQQIVRSAREIAGVRPLVLVTFEPHPLTVLRPEFAPPRLSWPQEKLDLIARLGVDRCVVLPPTPETLNLSAEDFFAILRDRARVKHLVEGRDFNFGKARRGNISTLGPWCQSAGIGLSIATDVEVSLSDHSIISVSSSLIRWLIAHGRVRDAAACLGRAYCVQGVVGRGEQRGRTIGVPTANLGEIQTLLPAAGVYAGRCNIDHRSFPAAVSIGTKPTFSGEQLAVEVHVVGFNGDLYNQTLAVELTDWVRDQMKFPGIDALRLQLARDIAYVAAGFESRQVLGGVAGARS